MVPCWSTSEVKVYFRNSRAWEIHVLTLSLFPHKLKSRITQTKRKNQLFGMYIVVSTTLWRIQGASTNPYVRKQHLQKTGCAQNVR